MKRRDFVAGLMIASAMQTAMAQQPAKMKRVAFVSPATKVADFDKNPTYRIFFEDLNRIGYVEGQNLIVERYSAEGARGRYAQLTREVVGTRPDVICVTNNALVT
jgi:putative ABC transport system substrate-binding protein